MAGFDDELRAVLRERAAHVRPPVDPAPDIERRARRIRRRAVTAGAGGVLAVGLLATGVPYVVAQSAPDRGHEAARIAAAAPEPPGRPLTPLPPQPAPELSAAPENQLQWPTRGYRPQGGFEDASDRWYARHVADEGAGVRRHTLWSGPLPDSMWAKLEQYWSPRGDTGRWSTVLLVAHREGEGLHAAYENVTAFDHQRPHESASVSNDRVGRIAGYGFGFADFVLVVGSPEAEQASITLDGDTVRRLSLERGAVVFEPVNRGPVELFQLRDGRGRLLTPNDHQGARYDSRGAVIQGWTLDRR